MSGKGESCDHRLGVQIVFVAQHVEEYAFVADPKQEFADLERVDIGWHPDRPMWAVHELMAYLWLSVLD